MGSGGRNEAPVIGRPLSGEGEIMVDFAAVDDWATDIMAGGTEDGDKIPEAKFADLSLRCSRVGEAALFPCEVGRSRSTAWLTFFLTFCVALSNSLLIGDSSTVR